MLSDGGVDVAMQDDVLARVINCFITQEME